LALIRAICKNISTFGTSFVRQELHFRCNLSKAPDRDSVFR